MALIVETGAGLPNAESYISVADADTYHSNRGNVDWAALSVPSKEANLRKATDYITGKYRLRWLGLKMLSTQALDWPRSGVTLEGYQVAYTIVPVEVKNACAELALRSTTANLLEDTSQKTIEETVGPITVKYDANSTATVQYKQIDAMLRIYLISGGNSQIARLLRV